MDKQYRLPLGDEQKQQLEDLLGKVPKHTVVTLEWKSPEGQAFVKELRKIQLAGVPLPWIAEALGLQKAALQGAVGYWERSTSSRGTKKKRTREHRPIRSNGDTD